MANLPIIYRTTKGSPLTFSEGDNNLRLLYSGSIESITFNTASNQIILDRYDNSLGITSSINLTSASVVTVGTTPQPNPHQGSLWWDTTDGNLYMYYQYVSASIPVAAWVPATSLAIEGGGNGSLTAVSQSSTFPWTMTFYSGSTILTTLNVTGSATSSYSQTASYINPLTQSVDILGNIIVTGSLALTGDIVATNLYISNISSSIIYESGSTKFGDTQDDTHQFTGSVEITSSLYLNNVPLIFKAGPNITISSGSGGIEISGSSGSVGINVFTSSLLVSSSVVNVNFTGSGVQVEQSGSDGVLVTIEGGGTAGNLQDVTSLGNITSESISIYDPSSTNLVANSSLSVGGFNTASGFFSVAFGGANKALLTETFAHGRFNIALGSGAHVEGYQSTANGDFSHAEGRDTIAIGDYSHTEGYFTTAIGFASHAEGEGTTAIEIYSHAEGVRTIASGLYQHVQGRWNIPNSNALWIVGKGENDERSNLIAAYSESFGVLTVTGSIIVNNTASGIGGNNLLHVVPGPGITITSGSTGYIISASATSADNLQDVTTRGNETSQSITISNNLFITGSDNGIRISGPSGHLVLTSSNLILTGSSYLVLQNWEFLEFSSDFNAEQAGVPSGGIYRNGNFLMIRTGSAN